MRSLILGAAMALVSALPASAATMAPVTGIYWYCGNVTYVSAVSTGETRLTFDDYHYFSIPAEPKFASMTTLATQALHTDQKVAIGHEKNSDRASVIEVGKVGIGCAAVTSKAMLHYREAYDARPRELASPPTERAHLQRLRPKR